MIGYVSSRSERDASDKLAKALREEAPDYFSEGDLYLCQVPLAQDACYNQTPGPLTCCCCCGYCLLHLQAQQQLVVANTSVGSSTKVEAMKALEESCRLLKLASQYWNVERSLPELAVMCKGYCMHRFP